MTITPFPAGQFGVIYLDPPWLYKMRSAAGHAKSPHAHYAGMNFDELAALRDSILFAAAPDCVMVMWTTWPGDGETDFLFQSMDLMKIFGFTRKTGGAWIKTTKHGKLNMGPGYVLRGNSEPFIIGTRGAPKIKHRSQRNVIHTGDTPENFNDLKITIHSQAREHSRKPDEFATMLQELFHGPYLELFARTARPGWSAWGNEIEKF